MYLIKKCAENIISHRTVDSPDRPLRRASGGQRVGHAQVAALRSKRNGCRWKTRAGGLCDPVEEIVARAGQSATGWRAAICGVICDRSTYAGRTRPSACGPSLYPRDLRLERSFERRPADAYGGRASPIRWD